MSLVQAEIAEDLNDRLEFNSSVLTQRGRQIALSLRLMFSTPIIGALTFVILAYGQYGAATLQNLLHHLYPTYPEQKITKGDDGQHTLLTLIAEISSRNAIG